MKKSFLFMLMMLATISTMRANNILVVYFRWGATHRHLPKRYSGKRVVTSIA